MLRVRRHQVRTGSILTVTELQGFSAVIGKLSSGKGCSLSCDLQLFPALRHFLAFGQVHFVRRNALSRISKMARGFGSVGAQNRVRVMADGRQCAMQKKRQVHPNAVLCE